MCGINGFTFKDEALLDRMLQTTKHRGPDDQGAWFGENISLGHNRLSIIDLSAAGHQPMASASGNLIITYNGELYNFQELKQELAGRYDWRTKTDTEVILAAYQIWGYECVKKFNGMFAFAIWDKNRQELFLARDQMGIKPLYYYGDGTRFIFSSEIKGILCHPVERKLNHKAANIFFRLLYVPEPMTPWENIYKLPAAHYAVVRAGAVETKRYWQIYSFDVLKDKTQIKEQIRQTFTRAVSRQLVSDKPLGLYLSGGIDSTALLGAMSAISPHPVRTFSVGFDIKEQWDKYNSDFKLAKRSSQWFGSEHHEILIGPRDIKDNFEKVVWHADDLVTNHTQPTMYTLAVAAKKNVDVFLTGDGGDEAFAGYDRYRAAQLAARLDCIPRLLRRFVATAAALDIAADVAALVAIGSAEWAAGFDRAVRARTDGALQGSVFPSRRFTGLDLWGAFIRASGPTKGTALEWIAEHHGIAPEEVVAVGDWYNDLAMFQAAGLACAMGQTPDAVKSVADRVLDATWETGGGIAEAARCAGLL